jgi:hypothetical protein
VKTKPQFGPAGDNDARAAYLFLCPLTNCYGITLDKSGANLPDQGCDAGWQFQAVPRAFVKPSRLRWTPNP